MKSVFEFKDYKKYLNDFIFQAPNKGWGLKRKFAEAAQCQVAYVSHVLTGRHDFSLEQLDAIAHFIGLSKDEAEFLLLLLQWERAGTQSLKKYFSQQIEHKKEKYFQLKDRMKIKERLSREDQMIYYSKWYYSAIHMALTIPEVQTAEKISSYLNLPLSLVRDVLDFLSSAQLIQKTNEKYSTTGRFLHLEKDSPLISQHHTNWRMRAIESLNLEKNQDLHFSSCFTISESDLEKLRLMAAQFIETSADLIKPSKEEKLVAISFDVFEV